MAGIFVGLTVIAGLALCGVLVYVRREQYLPVLARHWVIFWGRVYPDAAGALIYAWMEQTGLPRSQLPGRALYIMFVFTPIEVSIYGYGNRRFVRLWAGLSALA